MTLQDRNRKAIELSITNNKDKPGALLPILHGIQDNIGYVPPEAVPMIASELNLSRAEVHGVISFYHFFRQTPPGRHTLQICQAESCQAMGSEALTSHAKSVLNIGFHQTTADEEFSLEPVYCLGNCACSPAVMIDDEVYGRVTPERLEQLLDQLRKGQQ
jgi:formate dehydrogenase subunit gamma